MRYRRLPIEVESPEQQGYATIDANLAESSVTDARLGEIDLDGLASLVLCYGDHVGHRGLRERIAAEGGGGRLGAEHVLLTPGAAAALFIAATALLEPGDEIVVVRPNYATNLETPRAIGASVRALELRFEEGFRLDLARLRSLVTPRTKLVSLTSPHNPTGQVLSAEEIAAVLDLVEWSGARLLVDETYREMRFGATPAPLTAALSARAISISSLSKTYGLPGIRLGWLVTRDRGLRETFLAAKEQIVITNSVVDEELAFRALSRREERLGRIRDHIGANLEAVRAWIARERALEWVEPAGGVVCFPKIRAGSGVDVERFYAALVARRTAVGPGHWFEMDRRHFRLGFGWPRADELARGLESISRALGEASS